MSDDGERVFFQTTARLVPQDTNSTEAPEALRVARRVWMCMSGRRMVLKKGLGLCVVWWLVVRICFRRVKMWGGRRFWVRVGMAGMCFLRRRLGLCLRLPRNSRIFMMRVWKVGSRRLGKSVRV